MGQGWIWNVTLNNNNEERMLEGWVNLGDTVRREDSEPNHPLSMERKKKLDKIPAKTRRSYGITWTFSKRKLFWCLRQPDLGLPARVIWEVRRCQWLQEARCLWVEC